MPTLIDRLLGRFGYSPTPQAALKAPDSKPVRPPGSNLQGVTTGQRSQPTGVDPFAIGPVATGVTPPSFNPDIIPLIRKLTKATPDINQAWKNMVFLGNTGHTIQFDPNLSPDQVDKMRRHLEDKAAGWGNGVAGIHGLVNKMIAQCAISGALSYEEVIADDFTGIKNVVLVNPETIRFYYSAGRYWPLQKVQNGNFKDSPYMYEDGAHIKLNPKTYTYFGLLSDEDSPYGIPPYISALSSVENQNFMMDNIKKIVQQIGLVGFMQALVDKPDREAGESDEVYLARLDSFLTNVAQRLTSGMRDGINVGYKDDIEFEFHNPTKSAQGVGDIFKENELQLFSGLNMDGSLMGRDYSSSESQIAIIFMKMLSEFVNIQITIAEALKRLYTRELTLAGYKFKYLRVEFKKSTLMDELKLQQGLEVKIRNTNSKYLMGIIGQEQAADELGYEKPNQKKPRVQIDLAGIAKKGADEKKGETERRKKKVRKESPSDPTGPDNRTRKSK